MASNEITHFVQGAYTDVAGTLKVSRAWDRLDVRQRATLERWLRLYAKDGPDNLPGEVLKSEGRHEHLGLSVFILAFRHKVIRLYGGPVPDRKLFLLTELVEKKTKKADPDVLKRAAKYLVEYIQSQVKGSKR